MLRFADIENPEKQQTDLGMEAVIAQAKNQPGSGKLLLSYLPQQHREYTGKSANEVKRRRAFLFEAFLHTGLPESALPFVLEVLETEEYAYLVAGAAMAVRGLPEPRQGIAPYLVKAIRNVKLSDNKVSFQSPELEISTVNQTTALLEICKTFEWLGSSAREVIPDLRLVCQDDYISRNIRQKLENAIVIIEQDNRHSEFSCCGNSEIGKESLGVLARIYNRMNSGIQISESSIVQDISLEDQNVKTIGYKGYFTGKPSVVVFFYTRCDNPNKCSLTIARLRDLQNDLLAKGYNNDIKIAAISYDAFYDDPFRIKAYCEARGMMLDENNRVFRVKTGMPEMLRYFDLGVNYMGSIINLHTTELFVVDHHGIIVSRHQQLQWKSRDVIAELEKQLNRQKRQETDKMAFVKTKIRDIISPILSFIIVFFPKCPLCLAAYMSVFGISNIHFLRFAVKLLPLFIILLCINLYVLYKGARWRNGLLPFYLSVSGLGCIIVFSQLLGSQSAGYLGIGLMLTGALLNSLPHENFMKLRLAFSELLHTDFRQTNR
jgi:protein SCO1/2